MDRDQTQVYNPYVSFNNNEEDIRMSKMKKVRENP